MSIKIKGKTFEAEDEAQIAVEKLEQELEQQSLLADERAQVLEQLGVKQSADVGALKLRAADGAAYRQAIVVDVVKFAKLAKVIGDKAADAQATEKLYAALPLELLKTQPAQFLQLAPARDRLSTESAGSGAGQGDQLFVAVT